MWDIIVNMRCFITIQILVGIKPRGMDEEELIVL